MSQSEISGTRFQRAPYTLYRPPDRVRGVRWVGTRFGAPTLRSPYPRSGTRATRGQASLTPALDAPREGRPIDQRACVAVGGRHCRHGETRAEVHGGEAAAHVTPLFGDSTGDGIAQTELPVRVCACGEQIPVQRFLDQTLAIGTRCRARQKNSPQHLSVPSLSVAQQCPASGSCCTHPTFPGPRIFPGPELCP